MNNCHQTSTHFILGMGRSGTTLLLSMLNSVHSNLCIPEIPLAMYLYSSHKKRNYFTKKDAEQLLSLKTKLKFIRKVTIDETYFINQIHHCTSYNEFILAASLATADTSKNVNLITNIIDKNPIYTFYTDALTFLYPKSKFILMVRNPYAYVNSCMESIDPGKKVRSTEFYSLAYKKYSNEIAKIQKRYKSRSLIIKYEDLVSNPESTLKSICLFLSVQFDQEMLDFHKKSYNLTHNTATNEAQKSRIEFKYNALSKPVNTDRTESWKKNLNQEQLDVIDSITYQEANKFGYEIKKKTKKFSFRYLKSTILIQLYFFFARKFYFIPIRLRELFRYKV